MVVNKSGVSNVDFLIILNSCTEEQKKRIEAIMVELLRLEMLNAERLIKHFFEANSNHDNIEELKNNIFYKG